MRPLRIFTWHVHGSYLYYLTHARHEFYLPVTPGREHGYGGRTGGYRWPANVHEVPAEAVRDQTFDCILFQSRKHYLEDQYQILSPAQQQLPRIYLEHDPPREHPTDTGHVVDDPEVLLVHVTHFNDLMWNSGRTPTRVIEHGVVVPVEAQYTGEIPRGIVVVNDLRTRGRRLGADLFERLRAEIPLDLVGLRSQESGGLGPLHPWELPGRIAHYRFFCNPIRYTSLGLAVCEAMMVGLPIVGLATTEMVTVIQNGVSGYLETNSTALVAHMRRLLLDPGEAERLGQAARHYARERFNIARFTRDWDAAFADVTGNTP